VVEDEAMVRSLAFTALQHAGYVVFQAPNGSAALKFLEGHPGQVDLVLTDGVMPRMTGRDLAEAIWARQPGLPILFMSGYSDDEVVRRGVTLPVPTHRQAVHNRGPGDRGTGAARPRPPDQRIPA
jgi:two-component system, cell cycle sensor histidine kinase and response regulator CckA